jgi:peptidoglycan/LPS O-acetylase OafA/YrhL
MFKNRIYELDALRGIAALMVVLFHYTTDKLDKTFEFGIGCIGVDLFFIISGFVILLTIENTPNWKLFLINRFSRLYPAYWTCVSITTISILIAGYFKISNSSFAHLGKTYFANLSMFQFYLNQDNIDGSYWTLILELQFYCFVLLFLFFNQKKYIELTGVFCLIFSFFYRYFIFDLFNTKPANDFLSSIPLLIFFPLFFSGILFYKLKFDKKTPTRWLLLLISFILQLYIFEPLYFNRGYITFTSYFITLSIIYFAFILYIFNKLNFIVNKYTLFLGSISYVLYLLHKVVGNDLIIPVLNIKCGINYPITILLTLIIIGFFSYLISTYIEKPALLFIRTKYFKK